MTEIRWFSQIFADFRFSWDWITAFRGRRFSQKTAGNHRISQKTAGNRRFLQKPVCPILVPPYSRPFWFFLHETLSTYHEAPSYTWRALAHVPCPYIQRAPNVHQQTCTSRWAENSKEWKFFSAARHAPTLHVFNVGPKWVFSFAKMVCEKIAFLHFPWKLPHFGEREKVAETLRQCTFSFDNLLFFLILVLVIAQEAPKTLKWPSGCAQLLVHIRRPYMEKKQPYLGSFWLVQTRIWACGPKREKMAETCIEDSKLLR